MSLRGLVPLLNVSDVAASCAFYHDALGFRVESDWRDAGRVRWARIACGSLQLMINEQGQQSAARHARPGHGDVVLYLETEDADVLHRFLEEKGLAPGPVREESYGVRQFELRDPDGYELAITGPPRAAAQA
jgi:catechol 2,3-dioxygenase-like lactoylglutathione lyase family enzyme